MENIREKIRLEALDKLEILDTPAEQQYDNITELAADVCKTPMAMISLLDKNRQWIKSIKGFDLKEGPRAPSFCNQILLNSESLLEIKDARKDNRFEGNSLVHNERTPVVYFAGYPIKDTDDNILGTLCVLDYKPRELDNRQKHALQILANQVELLLELRAKNKSLMHSRKELKQHNDLLKNFAGAVSHDLKMPLASIIMTIDVIKGRYKNQLDEKGIAYLNRLKQSSLGMSEYITNLLEYYESDNISLENSDNESFGLKEFLESIIDMLNIDSDCEINFPEYNFELQCNRTGLEQIFLNLLGNSLKYNDKPKTLINIEAEKKDKYYAFTVSDNGMGIPKEKINGIFELFTTAADQDKHGKKGNGIGLSTVQKLVKKLGGDIRVESEEGKGTSFYFYIKKQKPALQ